MLLSLRLQITEGAPLRSREGRSEAEGRESPNPGVATFKALASELADGGTG